LIASDKRLPIDDSYPYPHRHYHTGTPHLGNYAGAIRPAIVASRDSNADSFYSWPTTTP